MADPSLEVCPNFVGNLYEDIQNDLIAATGATAEEKHRLMDTMRVSKIGINNGRMKLKWKQKLNELTQPGKEEERLAKEAETEKKHLEAEKKKPKMNGFNATASVGDSIAPCPSQYAIQS
ncbi:hypothetical protein BD769DRAFT_1385597 [Suillus cothurnatus]|nr:hypothetical protein BD769DRAFT_1385597 [Suillus cothurnatus]